MTRQVGARKANESEPRMLCRKRPNRHRNQADLAAWDQVQQEPVDELDGDRQIDGASLAQAFIRNMGTWRFDAEGRTQVGGPQVLGLQDIPINRLFSKRSSTSKNFRRVTVIDSVAVRSSSFSRVQQLVENWGLNTKFSLEFVDHSAWLSERKTHRKTAAISSASRELRRVLENERENNDLRPQIRLFIAAFTSIPEHILPSSESRIGPPGHLQWGANRRHEDFLHRP